jgi:hypothetical protein
MLGLKLSASLCMPSLATLTRTTWGPGAGAEPVGQEHVSHLVDVAGGEVGGGFEPVRGGRLEGDEVAVGADDRPGALPVGRDAAGAHAHPAATSLGSLWVAQQRLPSRARVACGARGAAPPRPGRNSASEDIRQDVVDGDTHRSDEGVALRHAPVAVDPVVFLVAAIPTEDAESPAAVNVAWSAGRERSAADAETATVPTSPKTTNTTQITLALIGRSFQLDFFDNITEQLLTILSID